jgi:hypothetical protein
MADRIRIKEASVDDLFVAAVSFLTRATIPSQRHCMGNDRPDIE